MHLKIRMHTPKKEMNKHEYREKERTRKNQDKSAHRSRNIKQTQNAKSPQ